MLVAAGLPTFVTSVVIRIDCGTYWIALAYDLLGARQPMLMPNRSAPPRISLIICWVGPWRPWIHLFLHSCSRNPEIQFLIFTPEAAPALPPANVRVVPMTLKEIAARARSVLGCEILISRAYKLCDFKPLYGLLFADYLSGSTHWGYCDEDVFWGRIRHFLSDDLCAR